MGKRNNKFLNKIYSRPLPITLTSQKYNVSLPNLYPHNPISWVWYLVRYLQINILYEVPERHNPPLPVIYEDQIFKVTDRDAMMQLWRQGFFGKGILSRSEPSWYQRTLTRLSLDDGKSNSSTKKDIAMEDVTKIRRDERKFFKLERARLQGLELKKRQGVITEEELDEMTKLDAALSDLRKAQIRFNQQGEKVEEEEIRDEDDDIVGENGELLPLEFLQLQAVEAFFLKFALNRIEFDTIDTISDLFSKCCSQTVKPDNKFILDYVVYHYFRSNGWCVRSGVKFGTDYLLYKRGPPFIHAEYCILIMTKDSKYDWFDIATKARVVGSVKKAFVLCYVDYPSDTEFHEILNQEDIDEGIKFKLLFTKYKISEIIYKRWNPSRTRD
ncbi:SEN2 tRNA-splicing endonuclease subunit SEN2 [Candida maltosa Xu316]|uniref:tRNA-splicing endonuclease subunit Sen2 n=1 Tax=Candida maltosa (strain Xu316) TaxID=1245528 RepID=M3IPN4_CANMX|nr:tRNA-splicing endonuclease subunit, putative [Candida maltosa Xu316]